MSESPSSTMNFQKLHFVAKIMVDHRDSDILGVIPNINIENKICHYTKVENFKQKNNKKGEKNDLLHNSTATHAQHDHRKLNKPTTQN